MSITIRLVNIHWWQWRQRKTNNKKKRQNKQVGNLQYSSRLAKSFQLLNLAIINNDEQFLVVGRLQFAIV